MPSTVFLIHEDDGVDSEHLAGAIEDAGYALIFKHDAPAAIEALRWVQPSCVVCDYDLRNGAGQAIATWFRKQGSDLSLTPIVALGSRLDTRTGVSRFTLGADVCVLKPCRPGEVVAQIGALIGMAERLRAARIALPRLEPSSHAGFQGNLVQVSIAAVLTALEIQHRSGTFEVSADTASITLDLVAGRLVDGAMNGSSLSAIGALRLMLSCKTGKFSFEPRMLRGAPKEGLSIGAALDAATRYERGGSPVRAISSFPPESLYNRKTGDD